MFNPDIDDCTWTDQWMRVPLVQVIPGVYESFVVKSWQMTEAQICDQMIRFNAPLEVRGLVTDDGTLWMSDVPQERVMMFNNARMSRGRVLVGGLGLGLYPQYAARYVESLTIIEQSAELIPVVQPTVEVVTASANVPVDIQQADVESVLQTPPDDRYDIIFLDTWHTLDPLILPQVNHLRDLAVDHLAEGGKVLLWGYNWMLRLFEQACEQLLSQPPGERRAYFRDTGRPEALPLLSPVLAHFEGQQIEDMRAALRWCREYIIHA